MRLLRHYQDTPEDCRGSIITLGNFDGFHLGHQAVLRQAAEIADRRGLPLAVLTTEPHPRAFFNPGGDPFRLTAFRSKAHYFETYGVDILYVFPFDAGLAAMTAQDFVTDVLVAALGAREIVVGYDYRFGQGRAGGPDVLRWMGEMEGLGVTVTGPVGEDGEVFSSTLIRENLRQGKPRAAAGLLGHWWSVEGRILEGDRRGTEIGFPTANLLPEDYLQPMLGVYAVRAEVREGPQTGVFDAIANFGRRPTFGGDGVLLEVHLFDFSGDIYGAHLEVEFVEFIRPERRFDGLESLRTQIAEDCRQARDRLRQPENARERFAPVRRPRRPS